MKKTKENKFNSIDKLILEESNQKNKSNLNIDQALDNMDIETLASPKHKKSKSKIIKNIIDDEQIEKLSYIKLMEHIINTHPMNE